MLRPALLSTVVASASTNSSLVQPGSSASAALSLRAGHTPCVLDSSQRPKPSGPTGFVGTAARPPRHPSPLPSLHRQWPMLLPGPLVNRHQGFLSSPDAFLSRSSISLARLCPLSRQQGMTRGMAAYIKKEFDKKHSLMALFNQPEPKEPNSRSTRPTQSFRLQVLPDQLQLPRTCLVGHASSFPPWARGEQWLSR